MKITRRALEDVPLAAYERLAGASFFASAGFLDVWRAMRGRPVVWLGEADGGLVAAIPGVEYGAGPLTRFASLPDGCYGGVLLDPERGAERPRFAAALLDSIVHRGYAKSALFDLRAQGAEHPGFRAERYETLVADLTGPDWAPPDKTLQSEIRKAEREGIHVEPFDWKRHCTGFLALAEGTARRHGERARYPARLFERLAALAARDPRVEWRYCEHEGRPAASQIYFLEGDRLVSWQDFLDKRLSFLKPNQYIRWTVCRDAMARGAKRLDLGATPPGASGVEKYKEHWGGRPAPLVMQIRWAGLGSLARLATRGRPG